MTLDCIFLYGCSRVRFRIGIRVRVRLRFLGSQCATNPKFDMVFLRVTDERASGSKTPQLIFDHISLYWRFRVSIRVSIRGDPNVPKAPHFMWVCFFFSR